MTVDTASDPLGYAASLLDAVGAARAVDGRGRSIFQNVNTLNIVGVNVSQGAREGNPVQYYQGVVAGRE